MEQTILLVDDEETITQINQRYLEQAGYHVRIAHNGLQALESYRQLGAHLIVTDVMMPVMDGYSLIDEVLLLNPEQPFLFITAKNTEMDKIFGLSLGADDFIVKPFSPRELVLRVTNILKRVYPQVSATKELQVGDLWMNSGTREVRLATQVLALKHREFDLLWYLASHPNHVFSKTELYERVWHEEFFDSANTLNVHIHAIRQALESHRTTQTPVIKTVWGLGYKLEDAV